MSCTRVSALSSPTWRDRPSASSPSTTTAAQRSRQRRDQMDPAVVPHLRRQYRPPSASRPRLQLGQLYAHAGAAENDGAVVADQPAREADQDRRQGRQPWSLRHFPAGRGGGVATDVRRHPVTDRPAPDATRASMRGAWSDLRQATAAEEVRLDAGKSARLPSRRSRPGCF